VVYDVGANLGFFSLLAARLAGATGRVESFEPVPIGAGATRANASLNGLSTIVVHEVAVGERSGRQNLLVHSQPSESHLADRGWQSEIRDQIEVEVVALDELIEEGRLPVPDLVKVDVEGSEIAVLQGMRRTLRLHDVKLVIELHETNREVAALLSDLGYAMQNLDGTVAVEAAGPVHVFAHRPQRSLPAQRVWAT
jgi:FkbM family methyltransferase